MAGGQAVRGADTKVARILVIGSLAESLINFRGDLLRGLVTAGHEVHAAAPPGPVWVDERLNAWGVQRHVLPLDRTGIAPSKDLRLLRSILGLCLQLRPDAALGYTIKPVVYGSIAARLARVPRVAAMVTGLGYTFMPARSVRQRLVQWVARRLYWLALHCADVAVFQNPDDQHEFKRAGLLPRGMQVLRTGGSGIHLQRFAQRALPAGPVRFLLIGRMLVDKGVREYLAAAHRLRQTLPWAQCHLVGPLDSNPSAIRQEEIEAAVAAGDVIYHGAVQDVRPLLADCHVYVLPSYREGTPRSVLEALAVGRPVITTDAPGCRETVVHGHNGELVPVGDTPALAASMQRLAGLPASQLQAMADASRQMAESRFDVNIVNATIHTALGLKE